MNEKTESNVICSFCKTKMKMTDNGYAFIYECDGCGTSIIWPYSSQGTDKSTPFDPRAEVKMV